MLNFRPCSLCGSGQSAVINHLQWLLFYISIPPRHTLCLCIETPSNTYSMRANVQLSSEMFFIHFTNAKHNIKKNLKKKKKTHRTEHKTKFSLIWFLSTSSGGILGLWHCTFSIPTQKTFKRCECLKGAFVSFNQSYLISATTFQTVGVLFWKETLPLMGTHAVCRWGSSWPGSAACLRRHCRDTDVCMAEWVCLAHPTNTPHILHYCHWFHHQQPGDKETLNS